MLIHFLQSVCSSYFEEDEERLFPLAIVTLSPAQVFAKLQNHPLNDRPYQLLGTNCHKWVIESLKLLGINVTLPIPTADQIAQLGLLLSGAAGVSWLLASGLIEIKRRIGNKKSERSKLQSRS